MLLCTRILFSVLGGSRARSTFRPRTRFNGLLLSTFALVSLFASTASAQNSIILSPSMQTVEEGEAFSIQLSMDFGEATTGGGFDISYDSLVSFISFDFDENFVANFGLSAPADYETAQPLSVGFGFFSFAPPFGFSGQHTIGTLTFQALGVGATQFVTTAASSLIPGPFYSPANPMTPMTVSYGEAGIDIVPVPPLVPVPEPSATLLMFLGLAGLSVYPSASKRDRSR